MDQKLIELYVQRGRLRERISAQRTQLQRDLAPLQRALGRVDHARALWTRARNWASAHPALVTAAVVTVVVWRPRRVFQVLRWGFATWNQWSPLRRWLSLDIPAR